MENWEEVIALNKIFKKFSDQNNKLSNARIDQPIVGLSVGPQCKVNPCLTALAGNTFAFWLSFFLPALYKLLVCCAFDFSTSGR